MGGRVSLKKCLQALSFPFPATAPIFPDPAGLIFAFPFLFPCRPNYLRAWNRLVNGWLRDLSVVKYCFMFGGKFSPVFPLNGKRFSRWLLLVEKLHCSIRQQVLTGFPEIETTISLNFRRKKILQRCVVSSRGSPEVWTRRIQPSRDVSIFVWNSQAIRKSILQWYKCDGEFKPGKYMRKMFLFC